MLVPVYDADRIHCIRPKGSCQVKKNPKIREKPPTHFRVFRGFLEKN